MKKTRIFCLLLTLLLAMQWSCLAQPQDDNGNLTAGSGCLTLDGSVPLYTGERIAATAKGAILFEMNSGTLVYAVGSDEKVDPSGMNKILTALLALEKGKPDTVVTVTRTALDAVAIGSVSAGLKAGEEMALEDLLYCMMVGSANDAAAVIAEHIGGSQGAFVEMMNLRALELGCVNTRFMNPHGLHHDDQYTTARDLAKITVAALENEEFVRLFSAVEHTVPATNKCEERKLVTTNYMMSTATVRNQYDERVTGGKTGALSTTDRSLIATAEVGELRFLTVVMSAAGRVTSDGLSVTAFGNFAETGDLLDHGFGGYGINCLLRPGMVMEQYSVTGGANDVIASPGADISAAMPRELDEKALSFRCLPLSGGIHAPVEKGQTIGTVEVWYGSVCVGQCDLVALFAVQEAGQNVLPSNAGSRPAAAGGWLIWLLVGVGVLLGVALVAGILLLTVRALRKAARGRMWKVRRKNRQRSRS